MFHLPKLVLQVQKQRLKLVSPGSMLVPVQELMLEKLELVHLLPELAPNLELDLEMVFPKLTWGQLLSLVL